MRVPALDVSHASRRIVSALASFAVALTMVRFAMGQQPERVVEGHEPDVALAVLPR